MPPITTGGQKPVSVMRRASSAGRATFFCWLWLAFGCKVAGKCCGSEKAYFSVSSSKEQQQMASQMSKFLAASLAAIAISGAAVSHAHAGLLVSSFYGSDVRRYDEKTGQFLGVLVPAGSGGLTGAHDMLIGHDGSLLVSSTETHSVLQYDRTTGAFLGTFVPAGSGGLTRGSL
jgi:hypothetical protein